MVTLMVNYGLKQNSFMFNDPQIENCILHGVALHIDSTIKEVAVAEEWDTLVDGEDVVLILSPTSTESHVLAITKETKRTGPTVCYGREYDVIATFYKGK